MKSKLTLIIFGGLLFLFPYILIERSCDARIGEDIAELEGRYDALAEEVEQKEEAWAEERTALAEEIATWIDEATEWEDYAEKKADEAKTKDVVVADLRKKYETLATEAEKIQNLLSQNLALEEQYHNMQEAYLSEKQSNLRLLSVIDTKDIIIMGLDKRLRDKDTLLALSEKLVGTQRKQITSLKTGRTLSQVLAIGGWSVALYKTLVG